MQLKAPIPAILRRFSPTRLLAKFSPFAHRRRIPPAMIPGGRAHPTWSYLVPPESRVADIGAHLGAMTRVLAQLVGPNGQVTCFEPVPISFDVLRMNLRRMGQQQVQAFPLAITAVDGPVQMIVPRSPTGGENHAASRLRASMDGHSNSTIQVSGRTLDGLFSGDRQGLDFVHVDAPGHELRILRGAGELLRKHRPIWWMTMTADPSDEWTTAANVFRLFDDRGYSPYVVTTHGIRRWQLGERANRYVFLTLRHLRRLPTMLIETRE